MPPGYEGHGDEAAAMYADDMQGQEQFEQRGVDRKRGIAEMAATPDERAQEEEEESAESVAAKRKRMKTEPDTKESPITHAGARAASPRLSDIKVEAGVTDTADADVVQGMVRGEEPGFLDLQ